MTINLETARHFLNRFGERHTYQTFDDAGKGRRELVHILHGTFTDVMRELARLNNAGAGIFFTVNQTDGRGRKRENVTAVRALFVDADGVEWPKTWHKCPNVVTWRDTAPGELPRWHAYWSTQCPLDKFTEFQKRLSKHYGTDPAVNDPPRVMRIPGFLHRKADPLEFYCHVAERTTWN